MKNIWIGTIIALGLVGCHHGEGSDQGNESNTDTSSHAEIKADEGELAAAIPANEIRTLYGDWLEKQVAAGEYCSQKTCREEMRAFREEDTEIDCMVGMPDTLDQVHYGDINGDGKPDAIGYANMIQCDGGNALMDASVCFCIYSSAGKYELIEEPKGLSENLGIGRVTSILKDGTVEAEFLDYAEDDARCCPSLEEIKWFRFVNGEFEEMEKPGD